jgi:hypothetical protein
MKFQMVSGLDIQPKNAKPNSKPRRKNEPTLSGRLSVNYPTASQRKRLQRVGEFKWIP